MDFFKYINQTSLEDLCLPQKIEARLIQEGVVGLKGVYAVVQAYRAFGQCRLEGIGEPEMATILECYTRLLVKNGLIKPKGKSNTHQNTPVRPKPNVQRVDTEPVSRQKSPQSPLNGQTTQDRSKNDRRPKTVVPLKSELLSQYEHKYRPLIDQVELVGEVPISKEELEDIANAFRGYFRATLPDLALSRIEKNYPAIYAIFLVGQGVYGYKGGDYWGSVNEVLEIQTGSDFGKVFERILKKLRPLTFKELQMRSTRYVSQILAHGGVPVYCLEDYFRNIVMPAVQQSQFEFLPESELLEEVLGRSASQHQTDKPVIYFLEYGGRHALDFFSRSCELARAWVKNRSHLSAEDVGLPQYVVSFFQDWAPDHKVNVSPTRQRIRKPEMRVDPWGYGLYLYLPMQPVGDMDFSDIKWKIITGDLEEEIPATFIRKGYERISEEIDYQLIDLFDECKVEFIAGSQKFTWSFPGITDASSLLCFDSERGVLQARPNSKITWVYYPRNLSLGIEGNGQLIEKLPRLPGYWRGLQGEAWDLSGADRLILKEEGELIQEMRVRKLESQERPYLEGGDILPTADSETFPVYVEALPRIVIPISVNDSQTLRETLSRWKLFVQGPGDGLAEANQEYSLAYFDEHFKDNKLVVDLEKDCILGHDPFGSYQINLRGPLGRDAEFKLGFVPEFAIEGLSKIYPPEPRLGGQNVKLSISCGESHRITRVDPRGPIRIALLKQGSYMVEVPGYVCDVNLSLVAEHSKERQVEVPLSFRVRRVRWQLISSRIIKQEWADRPVSMPIQTLLQNDVTFLLIDIPLEIPGDDPVSLVAIDMSGGELQTLTLSEHSANKLDRFDLGPLLDTLRMSNSAVIRLEVRFSGLTIPVASLTRDLDIDRFMVLAQEQDDQYQVSFSWREQFSLQCRALYLWSTWRPWQPVKIIQIPDDVDGEFQIELPKTELLPGAYQVAMTIVDPWIEQEHPDSPPHDFLPMTMLNLVSQDSRLDELTDKSSVTRGFENHLECALIYHLMGDMDNFLQELDWCLSHLERARSQEVIVLNGLIQQSNDKHRETTFIEKLVQPKRIQKTINDLKANLKAGERLLDIIADHSIPETWPNETCQMLIEFDEVRLNSPALKQLIQRDANLAVDAILRLRDDQLISSQEAVELLDQKKSEVMHILQKIKGKNSHAAELLDLLQLYNPFWGLPTITADKWIQCNAGKGRIERIEDPNTRLTVEEFYEGKGNYILHVIMHIELCNDLKGEPAVIDMAKKQISFPRVKHLFVCSLCSKFASSQRSIFQNHIIYNQCSSVLPAPTPTNKLELTQIEFIHNQKKDS